MNNPNSTPLITAIIIITNLIAQTVLKIIIVIKKYIKVNWQIPRK
jgi:hypothetical protein